VLVYPLCDRGDWFHSGPMMRLFVVGTPRDETDLYWAIWKASQWWSEWRLIPSGSWVPKWLAL